MSNKLINKPVEHLASLLEKKKVSSLELTRVVLDRAEKLNDEINAYIDITRDKAEKMAKKADEEIAKGNYLGTYHGIPLGIKDNIYFKDEITTMGSKIHKNFMPNYDATVISRLKNAGAVFTGKLNMHEYAHGPTNNNPHFGECKNPWNLERIPGSSSGGSGAAVISGMSTASIGTDTGGSIRIPASSCGIVGLKPTHGRVSKYGVFPLAWSLDHVGPMTRTVKDAASMMEIIAGFDKNDPSSINIPNGNYVNGLSKGVKNLVIGVNEDYFFQKVDSKVSKLVKEQIKTLEEQGAKIELINMPALQQYSEYALMTTLLTEPSTVHHENIKHRPEDFGEDVRILLKLGELPSAVDYLQAQQYRHLVKMDFQKAFEKVDVMITPTIPFIPAYINDNHAIVDGKKST